MWRKNKSHQSTEVSRGVTFKGAAVEKWVISRLTQNVLFYHFTWRSLLKEIAGEAAFQGGESKCLTTWRWSDRLLYGSVTRRRQIQGLFVQCECGHYVWPFICATVTATQYSTEIHKIISILTVLCLKVTTQKVTDISWWRPDKNLATIRANLTTGVISVTSNGWPHTTQLGHSCEEEEVKEAERSAEAGEPLWVASLHTHPPHLTELDSSGAGPAREGSDLFGGSRAPPCLLQPI